MPVSMASEIARAALPVAAGYAPAMHTLGFNHNPLAKQDFMEPPSAMRYQNGGVIMVDPAESYAAARR